MPPSRTASAAQPEASLPGLLRRAREADPEQVAVAVEDGEALTYESWDRRSNAQAHGLRRAGVGPGDRVALVFDAAGWTEYAVSYMAVLKAAAVAMPLSAGLTGVELRRILRDRPPAAVLAPDLAPFGTSVPTIDPRELEDGATESFAVPSVDSSAVAEILHVSGPLDPPAAVPRSHRSLVGGPSLAVGPPPASLLHAFPVGTVAGQDALCACLRQAPLRSVVLPAFDADRLCALLSTGQIRAAGLHPSTARSLLDSGVAARHDLSQVRGLILTSGRALPALLPGLSAAFPGAALQLVDVLGSPPGVRTALAHDRSHPASLGRPAEGATVSVADDAGQELGSGEVGRVWAGGVPTAQRGYLDEEGFLYVVAGSHDVVRCARSTVSKLELPPDAGVPRADAPAAVAETITAVWRRVLDRRDIGPDDDFFELGGDPFAATAALSLIEDACGVRVPLSAFLDAPTVAGLAATVEGLRANCDGPADQATVAFSQEGMLWHECFAPGSHNLPGLARRYRGPLDVGALRRALDEIVRRHGALRTTFELVEGRPVQVVHPHRPLELPVCEVTGYSLSEREAEVERRVAEAGRRPFDLVAGPLFEASLQRLGDDDHVLVIRTHHVVFDDWSVGVFRRELAALYPAYTEGDRSPLPEPSLQFADYSRRQRRRLAGPAGAREMAFWRRELEGAPFTTQLPVDDPDRPEGSPQSAGEPVSLALPPELRDGLRALARRERATVFMTMLAAFGVLVHRYSGQEDLLLATVVANRNRTELEGLIGCFTKKVPLRLRLSGDPSFSEALGRTREALLGALTNQDLPFEAVVQDVLGAPAAAHGLVPHVVIMFQGVTPQQELTLPDVETAGFETSTRTRRAHFMAAAGDESAGGTPAPPWGAGLYLGTFVIVSLIESEGELSLVARGAFHEPAVRELMESFRTVLAGVVADPARRVSELALLDQPDEKETLRREPGAPERLRGFRIERERIRSALADCPGVRDVAVELQADQRAEPCLVAYVVPDGEPPTLTRLRTFLWSRLPGCALPSSLLVVPRLPAAGAGAAAAAGVPTEAGPEGSVLATLWAEALGLDDPLAGGSNYWQAFPFLEALARARDAGLPVPGKLVTRNRTVETLATALAARRHRPWA